VPPSAQVLLALVLLAGPQTTCADESPRPARVIVVGIDTLRPDRLSAYGAARPTSPALAQLAAEGVRFDRAYASASWTLPSMASVFTSLGPPQHRVEDRGTRLADGVPTLARAFADADWLTAGFVTHIYVSSLFGLDAGFREWRELSIDWHFREGRQPRADAVVDGVVDWLRFHADQRFFLYVHLFDPHWDYAPPAPFDRRFTDPAYTGPADGTFRWLKRFLGPQRAMAPADLAHVLGLYDGEIAFTDQQLGRLFDALRARGLWDDALVVVLADHGEEFEEHGSVHHIRTLYEEVLRVPLVVKPPGGRGAARAVVPERVRLVDVAPTLVAMAGVPAPASFRGESLVPLLAAPGADRDVFARTLRHGADKVAVVSGRHKLIHRFARGDASDELYDLVDDPGERRRLEAELPEVADALRARARAWAAEPGPAPPGAAVELTPSQREQLRALGYE
jgi:arylsulfatase A-like enzyme